MELFFSSGFSPFSAAIVVVLCLVVLELVLLMTSGMSASDLIESMLAVDTFGETAWTNWLLVKGLPLSVAVVVLLAGFGVGGVALQGASLHLQGMPLPLLAAVPLAFAIGWVVLRVAGRQLAPLFGTNTTAVSLQSLVGLQTTLLSPRCTPDLLAEVKVLDVHGQPHWLMVLPADGAGELVQGDTVVLHEIDNTGRMRVRKV